MVTAQNYVDFNLWWYKCRVCGFCTRKIKDKNEDKTYKCPLCGGKMDKEV